MCRLMKLIQQSDFCLERWKFGEERETSYLREKLWLRLKESKNGYAQTLIILLIVSVIVLNSLSSYFNLQPTVCLCVQILEFSGSLIVCDNDGVICLPLLGLTHDYLLTEDTKNEIPDKLTIQYIRRWHQKQALFHKKSDCLLFGFYSPCG